jgi:predicted ATPase
MIEFVHVENFKSLLNASFDMANLNILTGQNSVGKSSLIQSLLLLRQSYEHNLLPSRGLLLQGDYVNLGTANDVLTDDSGKSTIKFNLRLNGEDEPLSFVFDYRPNTNFLPIAESLPPIDFENYSLFNHHFQYLTAERVGPRTTYETSDYHITELNSIGIKGEYAVHFINENQGKPLAIEKLCHPRLGKETKDFLSHLNAWMGDISAGLRINTLVSPETGVATLSYAYAVNQEVTGNYKPQNVGFGLSYTLPVVVALLRSKPGDLIMIENPEAHLHPAGQSVIGRMCALAAASGVQLIIETHSDHFLNSIRVCIKQKIIKPEETAIFFLIRPGDTLKYGSVVINPLIDENGGISEWPAGFFDEYENNLEKLL